METRTKNFTGYVNSDLLNELQSQKNELRDSLKGITSWLNDNEHWLKIQGYGSQHLDIRLMKQAEQAIENS